MHRQTLLRAEDRQTLPVKTPSGTCWPISLINAVGLAYFDATAWVRVGSPERVCEGGRSSLETGTESDREGGGSGKEKVIVGVLRAPGREGRMCRSLGEKRG